MPIKPVALKAGYRQYGERTSAIKHKERLEKLLEVSGHWCRKMRGAIL